MNTNGSNIKSQIILQLFKNLYREYKTYYLAPGIVSADGKHLKPLHDLGIFKSKIVFRGVSEIEAGDIDSVVTGSGSVKRSYNKWE